MHRLTLFIGAASLAVGILGLAFHFPPAFVFVFWGVLIVAGIVFERGRYKPAGHTPPGPNWVRTDERFFDEDGKRVTVWLDPASGERKYVAE